MIDGAHVVIYSKDAERDRAIFRDVLKLGHVDAGQDWLIFKLPPSEVAFHPAEDNNRHELYLICNDLDAEITRLKEGGVACDAPNPQAWGVVTNIHLPGGGRLGLYQPLHLRP